MKKLKVKIESCKKNKYITVRNSGFAITVNRNIEIANDNKKCTANICSAALKPFGDAQKSVNTSWNICKIVETKDGHSSTIYKKEMP